MSILILLLAFIFVTITVIKIFPMSLLNRKAEREEGIIYQIKPILTTIGKYNKKMDMPKYRKKFQSKLIAAGEPILVDADEFLALKELLLIVGGLLFYFVTQSIIITIIGLVLGFMMPDIWLNDELKKRQKVILRTLPDFLDLMTLTVEAGLDFGAALAKVLSVSKTNALVDEFALAQQEMRLGSTRQQALRNLSDRINLSDVSTFVSSLIQADQLGASLGPAMRIQADQMRIKRMQRAEKLGAEAPVKMLVPLMLFIFPSVFVMLFGPIIIKVMTSGF
ncbi:type II secretion system F family protein [candidate division KSB1 bacterium]|nr:type II secretion system F family protein [candidate division KSB1 bacterium]